MCVTKRDVDADTPWVPKVGVEALCSFKSAFLSLGCGVYGQFQILYLMRSLVHSTVCVSENYTPHSVAEERSIVIHLYNSRRCFHLSYNSCKYQRIHIQGPMKAYMVSPCLLMCSYYCVPIAVMWLCIVSRLRLSVALLWRSCPLPPHMASM